MAPAEVDIVLAHLADAAAALPQAASQLGDILAQAKEDRVLEMDSLTEIEDPDVAIDTARVHLEGVRDAALDVYRLLNAARNETAHIAVAGRLLEDTGEIMQDSPKVPRRRTGNHRRWGAVDRPGPRVVTSEVGDVGSRMGGYGKHRARQGNDQPIGSDMTRRSAAAERATSSTLTASVSPRLVCG